MRTLTLLLSCFLFATSGCKKIPKGTEGVDEHPVFIGYWVNYDPFEQGANLYSSTLDVDAEGSAHFTGGLKDKKGEFSVLDSTIYIDGRAFEIFVGPTYHEWMLKNSSWAVGEVNWGTHTLGFTETRGVGFRQAVLHAMMKNNLKEVDGQAYFESASGTYSHLAQDDLIRLTIRNDGELILELTWTSFGDTLTTFFDRADFNSRLYLEGNGVYAAHLGTHMRIERVEEGILLQTGTLEKTLLTKE